MPAPPFSSFPPSFSSFPDLEAGSSSRRADERSGSNAKLSNSKELRHAKKQRGRESCEIAQGKKDKQKQRDSHATGSSCIADKHSSGAKHQSSSKHHEVEKDTFLEDERLARAPETRSKLFFSDHKGDSLNVVYGGLHSGAVPKYSLIQHGRNILGLNNAYVIRREGRGIIVDERLEGRSKAPQISDKRTRKLLESSVVRRLNPTAKSKAFYEEADGFIRISADPGQNEASTDQPYHSITERDGDSNSDASEDSVGETEDESDPDTTPLSAREESIRRLEQELKQDPSATSTWLSLLEHSLSGITLTSKNFGIVRSEITTSVLTRAINAHPDNVRSPLLRLKLLKAGEDVWDNSKLQSEWENTLKILKHPDVWMEWIDWRLRKCSQGLEGCFNDVRRVLQSALVGLGDYEADILNLRVFWRLAVCFKQTGYVERGMALFQAQAELTFKVPDGLKNTSFNQLLRAFEEFWESEAPRVGELSAKGWSSWKTSDELAHPPTTASKQEIPQKIESDPYIRWALNEHDDADKYRHLPLRSTDDDDDDPYRTILFADIKSFLFAIRTSAAKDLFRLVWLHYLGVRTPGLVDVLSSSPLDEKWAEEFFASPMSLSSLVKGDAGQHRATQDSYAGAIVGREKRYRNAFRMARQWGYETRDPLESVGLNGVGRQWEDFDGDENLVRSVFEQLQVGEDINWFCLWLAFEAAVNLKRSMKVSKTLLAVHQSSPLLWSAHAHLERMRGRFDDARKVYQTILASLPSNSDGRALICWDYAEMEWLLGRTRSAREIVFLAADQQGSGGDIQILRSKRVFEDLSQNRQTPDNWKIRVGWHKLGALLELLTGSVEGAMHFLDEKMTREGSGGACHECLALSSLSLLYHHTVTLKNSAPRVLLRTRVADMLRIYPSNTVILGFFLECEKGEGVWGRVRELLGEKALTPLGSKSLSRRVAEVWISGWEEDRWKGEVERVKASLEAAICCDETRGSPIVWRILLEVEIKFGSHLRAKTILFRALGECPMVKDLYLLAFGPLRQEFSPRELNNLADTMAEKGIRLRKSLDDVIAIGGGNAEVGYESDGPVNELEYNSKELRRLMPY